MPKKDDKPVEEVLALKAKIKSMEAGIEQLQRVITEKSDLNNKLLKSFQDVNKRKEDLERESAETRREISRLEDEGKFLREVIRNHHITMEFISRNLGD